MREEQSGSVTAPICVNDEFFSRLKAIVDEAQIAAIRNMAEKHAVTTEQIKAALRSGASENERPLDMARFEERMLQERIYRDARSKLSTSYTVSYAKGYTADVSDVNELKGILCREDDKVESISIRFGDFEYGFSLRLFSGLSTARFTIEGERRDLNHFHQRILDLVRSARPAHSILYRTPTHFVLGMVLAVALLIGSVELLAKSMGSAFEKAERDVVLTVGSFVLGAAMPWTSISVMERLFPKLQVEYGPAWKRTKTNRSTFAAIITLLLIPILINLVSRLI
jgi:hypothetical protein